MWAVIGTDAPRPQWPSRPWGWRSPVATWPEELSGGQQQRVAVARGLALRGRVLLADEPTSELDHDNRERVLALLRAEADRGAIVVMATHDPEAASQADAEIRLDDGRLETIRLPRS